MDLSIIDRIMTFIKLQFSNFLMLEEFIVFLLLLVFFLYNEKVGNKKVRVALSFLLLFLFSLSVFLYRKDMIYILVEIGKILLNAFYFPNLIFYTFTVLCSFFFLIYTVFSQKKKKWEKMVNYVVTLFHLYLFIVFITEGITKNLSFTTPSKIYKYDALFTIVWISQFLFLFFVFFQLILWGIKRNLKKDDKHDIMN